MYRRGKCVVWEMCSQGNIPLAKCPVREIATRANVCLGKCQVTEVSVRDVPVGEVLVGEVSGYPL